MTQRRLTATFKSSLAMALGGTAALAVLVQLAGADASAAATSNTGSGASSMSTPAPSSRSGTTSGATSNTTAQPETATTQSQPTTSTAASNVTTVPAPPAPSAEGAGASTSTSTVQASAPEVRAQRPQKPTAAPHGSHTASGPHGSSPSPKASLHAPGQVPPGAHGVPLAPGVAQGLTPPLPPSLAGAMGGVPSFFINNFSIPPFLLPIYQAAGAAYGIPWQVLAAINEVETDYGRDLSLSSAGAEGWMQFLPSTWSAYGVDVNNDGFQDPYNPADAIFAAARYLKAAGGDRDIRGAVFAYNHSAAYVQSVMLRARLLGGTPPALLGAVSGLTEARFPVYAPAHFADGFPAAPNGQALVGTAIYSQPNAPAVAVQDGTIVHMGLSPALGHYVSLRDAYGNTYTYAQMGTVASVYPVLEVASSNAPLPGPSSTPLPGPVTRTFRSGAHNVYLLPLRPGAHVIAGTVLGHLDSGAQPHILFQIRPAGAGAPLVDPKPILDGWVKLQASAAIHAGGAHPVSALRLSSGQALLASKGQLERVVLRTPSTHLPVCERRLIADGRVDRRVLAVLAFLSASRLSPTVSAASCTASHGDPVGESIDIAEISARPVAENGIATPSAVEVVRRLIALQGATRPAWISGPAGLPKAANTSREGGHPNRIHIAFHTHPAFSARAADVFASSGLSPSQWVRLVSRLADVPDPEVPTKPSPAAIPDRAGA